MSTPESVEPAAPATTAHPGLVAALVAAWAELENLPALRTADTGTYSYGYADLADVLAAVRPVLARHGLALIHEVASPAAGEVAVTAVLLHASGEERTFGPVIGKAGSAQAMGSAVTYARRYGTLAVLGLAVEESDDDGRLATQESRSGRGDSRREPEPPPPPNGTRAPARNRTPEEAVMREALSALDQTRGASVRAAFIAEFGRNLAALDPAEHPTALAWLEDHLARTDPRRRDEPDSAEDAPASPGPTPVG